jgi:catechol 2,3-dioxygenase-like lactoylglutathione lyase family enzyme
MPDPRTVHHVGLHVRDLDASLAFYRDCLGFEVVHERLATEAHIAPLVGVPGAAPRVAFLRVGDCAIELLEYGNVERQTIEPLPTVIGSAHICLTCPDVRRTYEEIVKAGYRTVSEPIRTVGGFNPSRDVVYAIDPDGVRVELLGPSLANEETSCATC